MAYRTVPAYFLFRVRVRVRVRVSVRVRVRWSAEMPRPSLDCMWCGTRLEGGVPSTVKIVNDKDSPVCVF